MTTTQITYGKKIFYVQEDLKTGKNVIGSIKVSQLPDFVSNLECFDLRLSKTVLKKTLSNIEALGFEIEIEEDYGFDWEVKIYCTI